MQSNQQTIPHRQIRAQTASFYKKRLVLLTIFLALFFTLSSFSVIRAQIASIISEDGDGIVGVTSLMNATISGDVDAVRFFARSEGHKVVNQKNIGGATALHIAARSGNLEIAKILVDNGANVNATDNEGWTPIMRAATSGNSQLVQFFLQSGADAGKLNFEKETTIIHSASSGCVECLESILSSYDFVARMNSQILWDQINQAMDIATRKNDEETRSLLKEYVIRKLSKTSPTTSSQNKPANNDVITVRSLDDGGAAKNRSGYAFRKPAEDVPSNQRFVYRLDDKKDYNLSEVMPSKSLANKVPIKINKATRSGSRYKFLGDKKPYKKFSIKKISKVKAAKKPEAIKPSVTTTITTSPQPQTSTTSVSTTTAAPAKGAPPATTAPVVTTPSTGQVVQPTKVQNPQPTPPTPTTIDDKSPNYKFSGDKKTAQ